jgi:hypothetical protein
VSRRPLCAAVLALCAAGCGDDEPRQLDTTRVEKGIAEGIERDRPGTKVVSVTCPENVELRKGGTFTCRVKGSKTGEDAVATVTQTDDEGRVRYRVP